MCLRFLISLTNDSDICSHLINNQMADYIRKILNTSEDPDVQKDTFILLSKLIKDPDTPYNLMNSKCFSFKKLILRYMKHPYKQIQTHFIKFLMYLSTLDDQWVSHKLATEGLAQQMFQIYFNEKQKLFRAQALEIFMKCMCSKAIIKSFANSPELIKFLNFTKTCPGKYFRFCVTVMDHFSELTDMYQVWCKF